MRTMEMTMTEPNIKIYVARLEVDQGLLEKHPEHREFLERRIAESKEGIVREALKLYGTR